MAEQKDLKSVTAIVPAFNEGERIGAVLSILTTFPHFDEIIVIDDGSVDNTQEVAESFDVRYLKNAENRGKGYSMDRAVSQATGDVVFFCDADVTGLTHDIIREIVDPVRRGEVDMFIGMRNRKWYLGHRIITFVPLLGGERAITKELWQRTPDYYRQFFRIEAALNFFALYFGNGFQYKIFKGLSQVIKEKKFGFWEGTVRRWRMISNIFSAQFRLHFVDIPESARNRRLLALIALQSAVGIVIGSLCIAAAYYGPKRFVFMLFAKEFIEDPHAPLAHWLWHVAHVTATGTIAAVGLILLLPNLVTFLFTCKKLDWWFHGLIYKSKHNKTIPDPSVKQQKRK